MRSRICDPKYRSWMVGWRKSYRFSCFFTKNGYWDIHGHQKQRTDFEQHMKTSTFTLNFIDNTSIKKKHMRFKCTSFVYTMHVSSVSTCPKISSTFFNKYENYVYIYIYTCIHIYIHVCICIYIWIHMHINQTQDVPTFVLFAFHDIHSGKTFYCLSGLLGSTKTILHYIYIYIYPPKQNI